MITSSPYYNDPSGYGEAPERKQKKYSVALTKITDKNVGQLRKLFLSTFPIKYSENLYKQFPKYHQFTRFGYGGDFMVGAICARLEDNLSEDDSVTRRVYVMTLCVLPAWRRAGIASQLFDWLLSEVKSHKDSLKITKIVIHVQFGNDEAVSFYLKNGFQIVGSQADYYKTLTPSDAHILELKI